MFKSNVSKSLGLQGDLRVFTLHLYLFGVDCDSNWLRVVEFPDRNTKSSYYYQELNTGWLAWPLE